MKVVAVAVTISAVGLLASGCSGSSDAVAAPACDAGTFTAAVEQLLASQGDETRLVSLDGFECEEEWAVTFPTIGATEEEAYTYTQVFRADGSSWSPIEDRNTICGTYTPDDPTAYPADSEVPEAIWQPACSTN